MQCALVVDDQPLIRIGIQQLIEDRFEIVFAESSDEAKQRIREVEIAFATVDILLKGNSGLDVVRDLKKRSRSTRVLVVTQFAEPLYETRARLAGADGFVGKQSSTEELSKAICAVAGGDSYPNNFHQRANTTGLSFDLSDRELEVFSLIGEGLTPLEIANRLHRSRKTIETFRDRIRLKLKLDSTRALVRMATHWYLSGGFDETRKK